jgi:hypothetical protein
MAKEFTCEEDGVVIRGQTDEELVANAEQHLRESHPNMVGKLTRSDILAMAREV